MVPPAAAVDEPCDGRGVFVVVDVTDEEGVGVAPPEVTDGRSAGVLICVTSLPVCGDGLADACTGLPCARLPKLKLSSNSPVWPFGGRKLIVTIDLSAIKPTKAASGRLRVFTTTVSLCPSSVVAITSTVDT